MKPSYSSRSANSKPKVAKIIYPEDELYVGLTRRDENNSYYLFHTTLNPDNQYKMVRIGDLAEPPSKEFVVEKIRYGQNNDKLKYKLDKEKIQEWVEEEYGFTYSTQPSPWAPKKLGVKRPKLETGYNNSNDDDDSTDEESTQKKPVKKTSSSSETTLEKKLDDCYALLLQITNALKLAQSPTAAVIDQSDQDQN